MKEVADNNFSLQENSGRFSKSIENVMGNGENAHYKQFLHFPQYLQKTCTEDTLKQVCFGEGFSSMYFLVTH